MARLKRIDLPYCLYHVFSRTNTGDRAFRDSADREKFLQYLARYLEMFSFKLHAYCLMNTHFHLLLESGYRARLSEFMRRLLTAYTVYFNRRHKRHGHIFQGRFKSPVVDKTSQLLALSRYIHLNPSNGESKTDAEKYEGSSLRFYIQGGEPPYLHTAETLAWFNGNRNKYAEFIRKGLNEETKPDIIGQRYVGDAAFACRTEQRLKHEEKKGIRAARARRRREEDQRAAEMQQAEEWTRLVAEYFDRSLEKILRGSHLQKKEGMARSVLIYILREKLPWSHEEISKYMNMNQKSVICYHLRRVEKNAAHRKAALEIMGVSG